MKKYLLFLLVLTSIKIYSQNAIELNPALSYVQIPDNANFHFTGNVTYQIKVRICADISYYTGDAIVLMINCINPDSWGFQIGIDPGRFAFCSCVINGVQYNCISPNTMPADNELHTITGVRNSAKMQVYIDGILQNSITIPAGNLRTGNGYNHIGRAQISRTPTLPSFVANDASFWNKALNPSQILALLDSNLTGNEQGLVGLYTFNQTAAAGDGINIANKAKKTGKVANGITIGDETNPVIGSENELKICKPPLITISNKSVYEGDVDTSNMKFKLVFTNPYDTTVSVKFITKDSSAKAGSDYVSRNMKVNIEKGKISKIVSVSIIGDTVKEKNEKFIVTLSNPLNAMLANTKALGTIKNDDDTSIVVNSNTVKLDSKIVIKNLNMPTTVKLFPNPVHSLLHIDGLNANTNILIVALNTDGKPISKIIIHSSTYDLDVSRYASGIYFLKVGSNTYKFIKQ